MLFTAYLDRLITTPGRAMTSIRVTFFSHTGGHWRYHCLDQTALWSGVERASCREPRLALVVLEPVTLKIDYTTPPEVRQDSNLKLFVRSIPDLLVALHDG